jgi:hypothetical protein
VLLVRGHRVARALDAAVAEALLRAGAGPV